MDFEKTLVSMSQSDEGIEKQFSSLHPDLEIWARERKDGLGIPTIKVIKYIVACYDKESPVVDSYKKRWMVKKRESAVFAGLPVLESGHFTEEADQILFCQNKEINTQILRYLYLLH